MVIMKSNTCFRVLLCFTLVLPFIAKAQILAVKNITPNPQLYKKAEFEVYIKSKWENPYLSKDIALDMILKSPSGKTLYLPCYFESGASGKKSLWKARFAPREKGRFTYYFQLSKSGMVSERSVRHTFGVINASGKGFLKSGNNWHLNFDNGAPFRGIGENICWESRSHDDSKYFKDLHEQQKYNYEYMLPKLAHHGGNFFRTWISRFNLPLDWQNNFNSSRYTPSEKYYNPSAIRKIDRLFNLADSLNIYIMLTLGPGNYNVKDGGFAANQADFFVNPKARERYKDRLRYLVARWGFHTSLCSWEFFNEVDNFQYANKVQPVSPESIVHWHQEMSEYLSQTDPYKHLITTSISHRDIVGLNDLPKIDFNQKHIYKNTSSIPSAIKQYEEKHQKPYVIGEYSYEWDWSKNFDEFAGAMDSDFRKGLWLGLFSSTPVLPLSWWWEYFDSRNSDSYLNNVQLISKEMLLSGHGDFAEVNIPIGDSTTTSMGLKCGKTLFVYLADQEGVRKRVDLGSALYGYKTMQIYRCDSGKFEDVKKLTTSENSSMFMSIDSKENVVLILRKD